jgi:methanethiol S-methyltransferase
MLERPFVWTGGALFVASLAYCVYTYVFVWSNPVADAAAHERPVAALFADALLFGVFALHHSLLARDAVKRRVAALVPERLLRSFYVWTASLLLILACAAWQPIGGELYAASGPAAAALTVIQLIGVAIVAGSVARIDALELAGIRRASRDTGRRPATASTPLQTGGLYQWVRHPLYLGWILAAFAVPRMTGDRLAFAAVSTIYLVVAIPWEERALEREFPGAYGAYRRRVRWRVIPYVY